MPCFIMVVVMVIGTFITVSFGRESVGQLELVTETVPEIA